MNSSNTTQALFPSNQPRYIAFEGINGAGKSTILRLFARYLRQRGQEVVETREPGGTELGKELRSLLLRERTSGNPIAPLAEVYLFAADRAQHIYSVVEPALATGKIVLSDRSIYSSVAFQGSGRGLGEQLVFDINVQACAGRLPDKVLVFDIPVMQALARINQRAGEESGDAFESERIEFHETVRKSFADFVKKDPSRFHFISAEGDTEAVFALTLNALTPLLEVAA